MGRSAILLLSLSLGVGATQLAGQGTSAKPLEIYVVDTEGGKADLWVTPSGQTLLIDAGSPGGRDTDRILEVLSAAGVKQIDYLLLTHYHVDHVGGVQELVKRLPHIAHFVDHGPTVEDGSEGHQREQVAGFQAAYAELFGKAQHQVVKPGDRLAIAGLDWRIVASAGQVLKTALPGGGKANPECAQAQRPTETRDPENAQSVGSVVTFGSFRAADFGDLTRDVEFDLMCPSNRVGAVDLFFASNHGTNNANSPLFIHGLQPRAAVVQNGTGKGASIDMFQALRSTPGFEDVWQLHWANPAGVEHNSPGVFIANGVDPAAVAAALTAPPRGGGRPGGARGPAPVPGAPPAQAPPEQTPPAQTPPAQTPPAPVVAPAPAPSAPPGAGGAAPPPGRGGFGGAAAAHTPAHWIKVTVQPNGDFTITNSRNNFSKTYVHRAQ